MSAIRFPEPDWLAPDSDALVNDMLDDIDDDEWRRLHRRFLADDVRSGQPEGIFPRSWVAFVRAGEEIRRRNMGEGRT